MAKKDQDSQAESNQLDKFKETAREVETDDREETFDRALKRVAKANDAAPPNKGKA